MDETKIITDPARSYEFPIIQRLKDKDFRENYFNYISYYTAATKSVSEKTALYRKEFKYINNVNYQQKNIKYNFMKLLRWMNTSIMLIGSPNGTYNIIHRTENGFNSYTAVNYYGNGADYFIRLVYYNDVITAPPPDNRKNFDNGAILTYTKELLDVLFGLYTFEQFAKVGSTCLIPDLLKIVYDYTFMY